MIQKGTNNIKEFYAMKFVDYQKKRSESDTENTSLINMKKIENDYETATYEQSFHSHIYENQLELLLD